MKHNKRSISTGIVVLATALASASALAAPFQTGSNYFVRSVLRVGLGGELIDNPIINGAHTSNTTQGVVGRSESTSNLEDGTVKMYLESGPQLQFLQAFGSFGDRVTVTNGQDTQWNMSFSLEGSLMTYGGAPVINDAAPPLFWADIGLAIFEPGQVTWNTFNDSNDEFDPLFRSYNQHSMPIDSSAEETYTDISFEASGGIPLDSNFEVFDIFAWTNIWVASQVGDGLEYYEADFLNTASLDLSFAPGVTGYSSSGQFMGLGTPPPRPSTGIPSPGGLALFGIGLMGLRLVKRKKRV